MLGRALILLILLTAHAVAQPTSEPTPMAQAVAAIKLKPNWQRIEITEETPTSYRLQLYYKPLGQRHSPVGDRRHEGNRGRGARRIEEGGKGPRQGPDQPRRMGTTGCWERDDGEASHQALR
jgi:hypothetical protein